MSGNHKMLAKSLSEDCVPKTQRCIANAPRQIHGKGRSSCNLTSTVLSNQISSISLPENPPNRHQFQPVQMNYYSDISDDDEREFVDDHKSSATQRRDGAKGDSHRKTICIKSREKSCFQPPNATCSDIKAEYPVVPRLCLEGANGDSSMPKQDPRSEAINCQKCKEYCFQGCHYCKKFRHFSGPPVMQVYPLWVALNEERNDDNKKEDSEKESDKDSDRVEEDIRKAETKKNIQNPKHRYRRHHEHSKKDNDNKRNEKVSSQSTATENSSREPNLQESRGFEHPYQFELKGQGKPFKRQKIKVIVEDKSFRIHKDTLALHSQAIRREFNKAGSSMPSFITLRGMTKQNFAIVRNWMNGDNSEVTKHNVYDIQKIADKLEMPELRRLCDEISRSAGGDDPPEGLFHVQPKKKAVPEAQQAKEKPSTPKKSVFKTSKADQSKKGKVEATSRTPVSPTSVSSESPRDVPPKKQPKGKGRFMFWKRKEQQEMGSPAPTRSGRSTGKPKSTAKSKPQSSTEPVSAYDVESVSEPVDEPVSETEVVTEVENEPISEPVVAPETTEPTPEPTPEPTLEPTPEVKTDAPEQESMTETDEATEYETDFEYETDENPVIVIPSRPNSIPKSPEDVEHSYVCTVESSHEDKLPATPKRTRLCRRRLYHGREPIGSTVVWNVDPKCDIHRKMLADKKEAFNKKQMQEEALQLACKHEPQETFLPLIKHESPKITPCRVRVQSEDMFRQNITCSNENVASLQKFDICEKSQQTNNMREKSQPKMDMVERSQQAMDVCERSQQKQGFCEKRQRKVGICERIQHDMGACCTSQHASCDNERGRQECRRAKRTRSHSRNKDKDIEQSSIEIFKGVVSLIIGNSEVKVNRYMASKHSKVIYEMVRNQNVSASSVAVRGVDEAVLREVAGWLNGDYMCVYPNEIKKFMAVVCTLDMPELSHKLRHYQICVDSGCCDPLTVAPDEEAVELAECECSEMTEAGNYGYGKQRSEMVDAAVNVVADAFGALWDAGKYDVTIKEKGKERNTERKRHTRHRSRDRHEKLPVRYNTVVSEKKTEERKVNEKERRRRKEELCTKVVDPDKENYERVCDCRLVKPYEIEYPAANSDYLCGREKCVISKGRLLTVMNSLQSASNVILGENFCGGNGPFSDEEENSCYQSDHGKFPFNSAKYHWVVEAPKPMCVAFCASVLVGNNLIVSGGRMVRDTRDTSVEAVTCISCFNLCNRRWIHSGFMRYARIHHAVVELNGDIYFIGGIDENLRMLASVENLNLSTGQCNEVSPLSIGRAGLSAATFRGTIWVAGGLCEYPIGYKNSYVSDIVESYDPCVNSWHSVQCLSTPRAFATMIPCEDVLYVVGGVTTVSKVDSCNEAVEPVSKVESITDVRASWMCFGDLRKPRYCANAVVFNRSVYVFGGMCLKSGIRITLIEKMCKSKKSWDEPCDEFSVCLLNALKGN